MRDTYLIAITQIHSELVLREYLDIAIVAASYDIPAIIYLTEPVVRQLQIKHCIDMEQTFKMIGDFNIALFSNCTTEERLYRQSVMPSQLDKLIQVSQHYFLF
ncbi:MAG: hypothetical protein CSA45_04160 [Gammaproteobacteria bacterium]|nr:MAG: hypothetical protein CSA45_04160 [Gammaproteobacteria bacterium]